MSVRRILALLWLTGLIAVAGALSAPATTSPVPRASLPDVENDVMCPS